MTTNGSNRRSTEIAQDSHGTAGHASGSPDAKIGELSRQMLSRLSDTIEGDIIPRLMLAFDSPRTESAHSQPVGHQLQENVEEFVHLLLHHEAPVATNYVSTLRSDGIPLSALYLDLLSPAARRLGVMWEQDECSFTDVTIGVCRMHQVLLEFSRCFDATKGAVEPGRNALIIPVPGEQHTFGIFMVVEFLRKAGWHCYSSAPTNRKEFLRLIKAQDFDVIGFSVSADKNVEVAAQMIADIRRGSRNDNCVIMAGGRAFLDNPSLANDIGADTMAADGREAVRELRKLFRETEGKSAS